MKTTTHSTVDCPSYMYTGMNNKRKKNNFTNDLLIHENGPNPYMNQQQVTPPSHVWDRIEMILNNQSNSIARQKSMNKDLLSPRKK
jgi:hypothetical protein